VCEEGGKEGDIRKERVRRGERREGGVEEKRKNKEGKETPIKLNASLVINEPDQ
jgi:hypothetical protein